MLLLVYASGFQIWDIDSPGACRELVSVRESPGAVTALLPLPQPERPPRATPGDSAAAPPAALPDELRPLVAVAGPSAPTPVPAAPSDAEGDAPPPPPPPHNAAVVRFYSARRGEYAHSLPFRSPVLALRATARIVAVALDAQVYGLDAATLEARRRGVAQPSPRHD